MLNRLPAIRNPPTALTTVHVQPQNICTCMNLYLDLSTYRAIYLVVATSVGSVIRRGGGGLLSGKGL